MFKNRIDAGVQLGLQLINLKNAAPVILAIPRGGVPVALKVAEALAAPIDLLLVKKLGHPFNKEYAIGAVSAENISLIPHEDVSKEYVEQETKKIRKRLNEMKRRFQTGNHTIAWRNRTILIVDDGVATGNTLLAAIPLVRKYVPAKIIIAVPVISVSARKKLQEAGAEVIAVTEVESMGGIGQFYEDFSQLTDEEIISMMRIHSLEQRQSNGSRSN